MFITIIHYHMQIRKYTGCPVFFHLIFQGMKFWTKSSFANFGKIYLTILLTELLAIKVDQSSTQTKYAMGYAPRTCYALSRLKLILINWKLF